MCAKPPSIVTVCGRFLHLEFLHPKYSRKLSSRKIYKLLSIPIQLKIPGRLIVILWPRWGCSIVCFLLCSIYHVDPFIVKPFRIVFLAICNIQNARIATWKLFEIESKVKRSRFERAFVDVVLLRAVLFKPMFGVVFDGVPSAPFFVHLR